MSARKGKRNRRAFTAEQRAKLERERTESEAFAEREAERERQAGLADDDAGARFIRAAERGKQYDALSNPKAKWRSDPATPGQVRELRRLGANPLAFRVRGDAADEIDRRKGGKR